MLYEFLIRYTIDGEVQGAHWLAYDGVNPPHPKNVREFTPEELEKAPDWAIELMQQYEGSAAIAALKKEITQLKNQLSPAIHEILPALEAAGLSEWAGAAITAAPDNGVAVRAVVELRSIAAEPPNWSQCDRIKLLFGALIEMSGVVPTSEQAQAMQQILDKGPDSTGPVSPEKLNFHPFMGI